MSLLYGLALLGTLLGMFAIGYWSGYGDRTHPPEERN